MGISNLYANLPGQLVEFRSGGSSLVSKKITEGAKSLLILGTAVDGPVGEPVQIDQENLVKLFGSDVGSNNLPNGATLTKYAKQAFRNGFEDVRVMRITGSSAKIELSKPAIEEVELLDAEVHVGVSTGNVREEFNLEETFLSLVDVRVDGNRVENCVANSAAGTVVVPAGRVKSGSDIDFVIEVDSQAVVSTRKRISSNTEDFTIEIMDDRIPATFDVTDYSVKVDGIAVTSTFAITELEGAVTGVTLTIAQANVTEAMIGKYAMVEYFVPSTEEKIITKTAQSVSLVKTLSVEPIADSITVYANKLPVTNDCLTVEADKVTITISQDYIDPNAIVTMYFEYEKINSITESMVIESVYGGSEYNQAKCTINKITDASGNEINCEIILTKPMAKKFSKNEEPLVFSTASYPTFGLLAKAINNHSLNNVFKAHTAFEDTYAESLTLSEANGSFKGGEDGVRVTKNELFDALSGVRDANGYLLKQGAYQILENYSVDYIYPAGVYANDKVSGKNKSFHYELALICAVLSYRTKATHGIIDMKPNTDTTLAGVQKHVDSLLAYKNIQVMVDEKGDVIYDANDQPFDLGQYTSVVAGPEPIMVSDTLGTYYGSPSVAYAALNANINVWSAPTNKALIGTRGLRYRLSNQQMNGIVGNRMVVFKVKGENLNTNQVPYVVDGCTAALPNSTFGRLTTIKITADVTDSVREVAEPFIGEPNTVEQRNALAAQISKRLSSLKEKGEILYYDFEISSSIEQQLVGEASVILTISCPQELRKITFVVSLQATA